MNAPGGLIAGRYRLVNRVAVGGMGSVWEGWDELLQRRVAVKQLLPQPGLSQEDAEIARHRVIREARITARLHHPHAVTLYDVVEEDGRPCLIMQFVPSRSLSALLRDAGRLEPVVVARIGAEVAAALAAAHQVGIVHRDVKPSNVLISEDGSAKLTDFGISHAVGDVNLTSTGLLTGTPAYLAPEVARGSTSGFPADVFSLGATLYAALEGMSPFGTASNPMAILHRAASGQVIPPQRSGPLTYLLMSMLTREPADRPLMADIARLLAAQAADVGTLPAGVASATGDTDGGDPTAIVPIVGQSEPEITAQRAADRATGDDEARVPGHHRAAGLKRQRRRPAGALLAAVAAVALIGAIILGVVLLGNRRSGGQASATSVSPTSVSPTSVSPTSVSPTPASPTSVSPTSALGGVAGGRTPGPVSNSRGAGPGASTAPASTNVAPAPRVTVPSRPIPGTTRASGPGSSGPGSTGPASSTARPSTSPDTSASSRPASPSVSPTPATATTPAGSNAAPTPAQLAGAITDYYTLMPTNTDAGWARLTARFQSETAQNRNYYQRYWDNVESVTATDAGDETPGSVTATITYHFRDGQVAVERTIYSLVKENGILKIDSSNVLSSQQQ